MEKQTGFGRNFGHHFGQKLGRKLGKEIGRKGEAIGQMFDQRVEEIAEQVTTVAQSVKQTASEAAKTGLDQILLNLEHRGLNVKDTSDFSEIVQKVSQTVLDRAEKIRSQITEHPAVGAFAPSWMKEPLVKVAADDVKAEAAGSMTEATVSTAAEDMQTPVNHDGDSSGDSVVSASGTIEDGQANLFTATDEAADADDSKARSTKSAKSKTAGTKAKSARSSK